ncbi:MAG TPA: pyridoxamine 5'-phosphate oxidase family protein [Azonexus sp.]|nr:pyridoxamine 5'-phosphate oxidase family protein [Azonexus sp.]
MKIELTPVIHLLHSAQHSTLASQSLQMPGYPYATVLPNVLDDYHRPVLLISALAEHTKNILANGRVSISIVEPGCGNVQAGARLSIIGDAEQFEADEALKSRYLRYLPDAEQYLMLDFMFFRIQPQRIRYIGGVGKMGWLEADALGQDSISLNVEAGLLALASQHTQIGIRLLGIDNFGMDYCVDGQQKRLSFESPIRAEELLEAAVVASAQQLNRQ